MEHDPERAHARKVRLMARLTWPVLVSALMLILGPARLDGDLKVLVLALTLGAVAALNVPSLGVVQRARREGVPDRFVRVLAAGLVMRGLAALALVWLLW
jgi:hypothetical protein